MDVCASSHCGDGDVAPLPSSRMRGEQADGPKRWLRLFWLCTGLALVTSALLTFVPGAARTAVASYASAVAMTLGAILARRLVARRIDATAFVKATTVTRAVAAAWLLLTSPVVILAALGVILPGVSAGQLTGFFVGAFGGDLATVIGYATLLAMVGPGYTEYREGLRQPPVIARDLKDQ